MKVVVLGGSSPSTPSMFRCLAACPVIPPLEFVLVGRSAEHLEGVARASRLLLADAPVSIFTSTFDRREFISALHEADLVLVQVRFGGHEGRHFDETFPLTYGLCGDEGLGPGGLSAAWRAWPALRQQLSNVDSVCPDAVLLMLSSPIGILVSAVRSTFPRLRAYGICELPWTTLRAFTAKFDIDSTKVDFDYFGLNHIGWFYRVHFDGRDLLMEHKAGGASGAEWPSQAFVTNCGGLPTKYLRMHYDREEVLEEQRKQKISRAEILRGLSLEAYESFREGGIAAILTALERRPSPWYEHAVVPFILASAGVPNSIPFFLTGFRGSPGGLLQPDPRLEMPARFRNGLLYCQKNYNAPPPQIKNIVSGFLTYERTATKAVVERDRKQMQAALELHPWVGATTLAISLMREIVARDQN